MNRIVPNSYQKPNLYTDKLMRFLTGDEWKTLDYALRRTFGFQRDRDRISVSQFMNGNGRLDEAGEPVEFGTGLSREAQIRALNELMRFGILVELAPNNTQNHGRMWTLQLEESQVRFDLIWMRAECRQAQGRKRTEKARKAVGQGRSVQQTGGGLSDRPRKVVSVADRYWSVRQTGGGLPYRPVAVCPTDPQKSSKKSSGKTEETQSTGAGEIAVVAAWRELVNLCEGDESQATAVWLLQEKFATVTRLKRPNPSTPQGLAKLKGEWWPHLRQVLEEAEWDTETAASAMQEAVRSMVQREKPLNVVAPRSIVNVTAGVLAGKRRGAAGKQDGLKQRPKGLTGIDSYLERRGMNGN
jgi:hypothetical protein